MGLRHGSRYRYFYKGSCDIFRFFNESILFLVRAYNIPENNNIAMARPIFPPEAWLLNMIFSSHKTNLALKKSTIHIKFLALFVKSHKSSAKENIKSLSL